MFNMDISGLDKLQHDLREAQRALESLDGTLATVKINPADPESIKAALREMEAAIDSKIAPYRGNAFVSKTAEAMKEKYREKILRCCKEHDEQRPGDYPPS